MNTPAAHGALCRFCSTALRHTFVDLGMSPLCQTQIAPEQLDHMEPFFPLHVYVCEQCLLVQLREYVAPDVLFSADYPYYSSYSESWVRHAEAYVEHVQRDHGIGADAFVVELASNDGYLLQYFVEAACRCWASSRSAEHVGGRGASKKASRTSTGVFGVVTRPGPMSGETGPAADLHARQQRAGARAGNSTTLWRGMQRRCSATRGVITMEFPHHLLRLIEENQFDTIYHEHFSYLSFTTVAADFCLRTDFACSTYRNCPRTAARCGFTPATRKILPSRSERTPV